ncbi:ABC transporter permease subunit [Candidatus Sumerlaeota bacterium]|nr:ABC transporter permease subunit [Candidatus Sumerlaeota bacterium]
MGKIFVIFKRELGSYFITPLAYVFIIIFLFLSGIFTFNMGSFFARNEADMVSYFRFLPWLYLFLIPAITMRLWSEERKQGTIELLMTLPISLGQAVIGKFLAAWVFTIFTLSLTFPLWITVNYLGDPDNGIIVASYIAAALMAGAFLAIGAFVSAISKNQVISFVVTVVISLLFVLSGTGVVIDFFREWAPDAVVRSISELSFLSNSERMSKGVIDIRNIITYLSMIVCLLIACAITVDMKKAD